MGNTLYIDPNDPFQQRIAGLKPASGTPTIDKTVYGAIPDALKQHRSDFQTGANGLAMHADPGGTARYFPKDYFDQAGTYVGPNPNAPDWNAQGSYFKDPLKWNYSSGKFERPTNWQHVIGTGMMAAGGVAGLAGGVGGLSGLATKTAVQGAFNTGLQSATSGSFDPKSAALNFIPGVSAGPAGSLKNTLAQAGVGAARGALTGGVKGALTGAASGAAGAQAGRIAPAITENPLARKAINLGVNTGMNTARTGQFSPIGTALNAAQTFTAPSPSRNPIWDRVNKGVGIYKQYLG